LEFDQVFDQLCLYLKQQENIEILEMPLLIEPSNHLVTDFDLLSLIQSSPWLAGDLPLASCEVIPGK